MTNTAAYEPRTTLPIGDRLVCWALALVLVTPQVGPAAEAQSEAENWGRLRSMPREERLALWEKIQEFDALGRSEKAAIRALDARIAQLPPTDRANYRSVLRRYHHWVQGLSEAQRNELNATPPRERMRLVTKLRAGERTTSSGQTTPLFLQVMDFGASSPFDMANRLKVWFDLTPAQRAEIEKLPSPAEQQKRLVELGQQAKVGHVRRLTKAEEDALVAKIEAHPDLKPWMNYPLKKADPTKHEKVKRRLADRYYFIEHPPASVDPAHLMRFESALPSGYREQFDHLPPEEARRRLTVLYRLIFPAPKEMPEDFKATGTRRTSSPPAARAPRPTSPARPGTPARVNPF